MQVRAMRFETKCAVCCQKPSHKSKGYVLAVKKSLRLVWIKKMLKVATVWKKTIETHCECVSWSCIIIIVTHFLIQN